MTSTLKKSTGKTKAASRKGKPKGKRDPEYTMLAMLCYLSVFVIVALFAVRKDDFVRFHARQGFVLLMLEFITIVVGLIPLLGWIIAPIAWFMWLLLSLMGIWNVAQGKQTELPFVGKYVNVLKL